MIDDTPTTQLTDEELEPFEYLIEAYDGGADVHRLCEIVLSNNRGDADA